MESQGYWHKVSLHRLSRRRVLAGAATLGMGATVVALAGCGGGGSSSSGSSAQSQTGTGGAPVMGGSLKVGYTLDPGTLDPHIGTSGGDAIYVQSIFNNLLRLKNYVPDASVSLAESWEIPDPTTINFKLRPGVQFHDGTTFNSDVVKWNIARIQDPNTKAANRGQLASIDHVETPDQSTARVILKEPNAALLDGMSSYRVAMLPPATFEKLGKEFGSKPVGSGPFQFVEWLNGSHMTVKRFPNYWEKDSGGRQLPYLDQATIYTIPDDTVRYANLQTGDVDYSPLAQKDVASAQSNQDLRVLQGDEGNGSVNPIFNFDKSPMDDKRLRRAVMYALDASAVVKLVYLGNGEPVTDNLWPRKSWFGGVPVSTRPNYDPAQAKALLSAAGKTDSLSFDTVTYASPQLIQRTEIFQEQMSKVGIKTNITTQDVSTATVSFFTQGLFPFYSTSFGTSLSEPASTCASVLQGTAFYNAMHRPISQELEDLIKKGVQTYDRNLRKPIYTRIAEIDLDECYFMPMVYMAGFSAWRNKVGAGNLDEFRYFGANRLEALWLKNA